MPSQALWGQLAAQPSDGALCSRPPTSGTRWRQDIGHPSTDREARAGRQKSGIVCVGTCANLVRWETRLSEGRGEHRQMLVTLARTAPECRHPRHVQGACPTERVRCAGRKRVSPRAQCRARSAIRIALARKDALRGARASRPREVIWNFSSRGVRASCVSLQVFLRSRHMVCSSDYVSCFLGRANAAGHTQFHRTLNRVLSASGPFSKSLLGSSESGA